MNRVTVEIKGRQGSWQAIVSVEGIGRKVDVGLVAEDPQGAWEIHALAAGNGFADGLRFSDFLEAVATVAKS